MSPSKYWFAALPLVLSINALAIAEETKKPMPTQTEEHEQHGTHEHGVGSLTLVKTGEGLEIALESPAANLLGFEHAATSDEDKQKLAAVKTQLEAGSELFIPNSEAACSLTKAQVASSLLGNAPDTESTHTEQQAPKNDKKEHQHDEHEGKQTHNDMDVTWTFTCSNMAKLSTVDLKLFSAFPEGFHKLKVEWVTDQGASAQELEKDSTLQL